MAIKVTHYNPLNDPTQNVVALVNFYIEEWGLHLYGCKYIRKKNGGFFISFPSKKIMKEGEPPSYLSYFKFDQKVNERFQTSGQKAIHEYINQRYANPQSQEG